jgi:hypothetical protein
MVLGAAPLAERSAAASACVLRLDSEAGPRHCHPDAGQSGLRRLWPAKS